MLTAVHMPKIQDLTSDINDGPAQNILKRRLKRDDEYEDPIDLKRTRMATEIQEGEVRRFAFSSFYFADRYLTDCNSSCSEHCSCHNSAHNFAC